MYVSTTHNRSLCPYVKMYVAALCRLTVLSVVLQILYFHESYCFFNPVFDVIDNKKITIHHVYGLYYIARVIIILNNTILSSRVITMSWVTPRPKPLLKIFDIVKYYSWTWEKVFQHWLAIIPSSVKYYVLYIICFNLPSQVPNKVYKFGFLLAGAGIQCKSNIYKVGFLPAGAESHFSQPSCSTPSILRSLVV